MKKILFWAAVTMLAAVSCNDKLQNDVPQGELMSFSASVDGAYTKTVIDGMKSYWDGTEGIRVLDGATSKVFEAEVVKTQTATFVEKDPSVTLSGDDFLALYPAAPSGDVTWIGDVAEPAKKLWLPGEQAATVGTYDPSVHISMAYAEAVTQDVQFKNVNALLKVTVANDNVSEICFYGNSQEVITGNFDVIYNDGEPVASVPADAAYVKNTYAKITGNLENGGVYYISILPCHFEKGFSVEFVIDGIKYTKTLSSEYTVGRNQIITLPVVEFEPEVVETTTVYLLPNSSWASSGSRYAAYCWGTDAAAVWYDMTDSDADGVYEVELPAVFENVIFCVMTDAVANDWNNKVAQTSDLTLPSDDKNCYIVNTSAWATVEEARAYEEPAVVDLLYLKPNSNWIKDNARFAAYFFGNGERWVSMTDSDKDGIYEVEKLAGYPTVIFCRMNPANNTNNWDNKWNQTGDLTIPTDGRNLFTVPSGSWDGSTTSWSTK